jgi:hypothetical protein
MASKMLMKGMAARRAFSTSKIVNNAAAHSHDGEIIQTLIYSG